MRGRGAELLHALRRQGHRLLTVNRVRGRVTVTVRARARARARVWVRVRVRS